MAFSCWIDRLVCALIEHDERKASIINNLDLNFAADAKPNSPCAEFKHQADQPALRAGLPMAKTVLIFVDWSRQRNFRRFDGLRSAEFRLRVLLRTFGYATLPAVVVNLVVSLVTVVFSSS